MLMFVQLEEGVFVREYQTLERERSTLFAAHPGQYVAIFEDEVLAVADTPSAAWHAGLGRLGRPVEFIVEHITERPEVYSVVPILVSTP